MKQIITDLMILLGCVFAAVMCFFVGVISPYTDLMLIAWAAAAWCIYAGLRLLDLMQKERKNGGKEDE